MNLRKAKIIFFKEMLETLRDKRTLFIMILGPVLVYPLMIIIMVQMQMFQKVKIEERVSVIEVVGSKNAPQILELIRADKNLSVVELESDQVVKTILGIGRTADVKVFFTKDIVPAGTGFDSESLPESPEIQSELVRATVVHDSSDFYSRRAVELLDVILGQYSLVMIRRDIAFVSKDEVFKYPVITRKVDISTPIQRGGDIMGNLLPMILIMMTIAGAMYPAIDATAGEKERGTIETILTAPASMSEIVWGKFLSVFSIAMATGLLNLLGMAITLSQFLFLPKTAIDFSIPPVTFLLIFVFLIPLAFLFGALMMAIATYARTFKEAQSYVSILYILCIFPAMLSTTQGFELQGVLTIVPVVNLALLLKELMHQEFILGHILLTFISTSIYAGLALRKAISLFHQENVLFSSEKPFSLFVRRRFLRPKEKPSPAEGLFLIAITFVLFFSAGSYYQSRDMASGMAITQIALILFPAILFAWYLKVNIRQTFSIKRPALAHVIAAIMLGLSSVIIASVIDSIQTTIYDPSKVFEGAMDTDIFSNMGLPLRLIIIALLPAICEEFMFRGFVFGAFSSNMRAWKAIVLTGIFFAFFHVSVFLMKGIPAAHIVLGIALTYLVYRSGSIFTGMLFHFVYNGTIATLIGYKSIDWVSGSGDIPVMIIIGSAILFLGGIAMTLFPPRTAVFDSPPSSDIMHGKNN